MDFFEYKFIIFKIFINIIIKINNLRINITLLIKCRYMSKKQIIFKLILI